MGSAPLFHDAKRPTHDPWRMTHDHPSPITPFRKGEMCCGKPITGHRSQTAKPPRGHEFLMRSWIPMIFQAPLSHLTVIVTWDVPLATYPSFRVFSYSTVTLTTSPCSVFVICGVPITANWIWGKRE